MKKTAGECESKVTLDLGKLLGFDRMTAVENTQKDFERAIGAAHTKVGEGLPGRA
jgi:hypothetical protein